MATTQIKSIRTIKKLPVFDDDKDLLAFLERSLTDNLKQFIRHSITTLVKAEMEQVRSELQQSQTNAPPAFNGYYHRQLVSPFGKVEDVPIPRFRDGFGEWPPTMLDGFDDEKSRTWKLLHDMHMLGVSQRKVKLLAKQHLNLDIGLSKLKDVSQELVMHESAQINLKALSDDYQYLFCDGIWEKVKGHGWDKTAAVVLCVLGVKRDGTRELIGFELARAEDGDSWTTLLKSIKARGLSGNGLDLFVMDDSKGCKVGIDRVFGDVLIQNCIVHKLRQVIAFTSHKNKAAIAEDLKVISHANSPEEATEAAKAVAKKWYQKEERAIASLRHNFEYCLTYFQFPEDTWKTIRSTNILEREFREVRRRTKVNDHSFNNFESQRRYHEGIFQHLNNYYPAK
jgi:transposase-like protein